MIDLLGRIDKDKIIDKFSKDFKNKDLRIFKYDFCPLNRIFIKCKDYGYCIKSGAYEYKNEYIVLGNDGMVITSNVTNFSNEDLINFIIDELGNSNEIKRALQSNIIEVNNAQITEIKKNCLLKNKSLDTIFNKRKILNLEENK